MRVFLKPVSDQIAECWVEIWEDNDWKVISSSRLLFSPGEILVDDIQVFPKYRGQGYGRAMIEKLKSTGSKVKPMAVLASATGFWDKLTPDWKSY